MANISSIKLPNGTTYTLKDSVSGYITDAGVTGVKGNAESSYRTGQVNLTPANLGAVALSGDTMTGNLIVPATRIANTYYGVSFGRTTETPVETILYTGIKWVHGAHMPVVHVTGYAYGLNSPVEFKIGFYLYGTDVCKIGWCGVTNMGAWSPDVYLFKYTRNSVNYVAIGFKGSCYFLQLQVDVQDEMGKFNNIVIDSAAWSWSFLTTTGTIPAADGGTTCIQVPYKANILNPDSAKSVPWSGVTSKPTATGSSTTGISIAAHGTGTVIGVQSSTTSVRGVKTDSTTTASKVTLGTAISIPNVTGNTDVTVPIAASSATTVPIKNSSATSVPVVSSNNDATLSFAMDTTDTKKLKISWSATPTRTVFGTATSIYGVQSSTTSVTGISGSTTASKVTLGTAKSVPNVTAATDVTVPIRADTDTTVPIKNTSSSTFVTGTTHTVTDNGHTHTIS